MTGAPPTRRELIADTAVRLLAESGARALTHRAVDAAAGLPAGSASNVHRTRTELIDGVIARLLERDDRRIATAPAGASPGARAAALVAGSLTDGGRDVLARAALVSDPDAGGLAAARDRLVDLVDRAADDDGTPLRPGGARVLVAAIDGVLLDAARSGVAPDPAVLTIAVDAMHEALRRH